MLKQLFTKSGKPYRFSYASYSDPGSRPVQEDAIGIFADHEDKCFVLCDGLGGHGKGDAASNLVVSVFRDMFASCQDASAFLDTAFLSAQDALLKEQKRLCASTQMKTTAVALVTSGSSAYIAHIGDSRLYIFHHNRVLLRTLDHSIPQMLVMTKEIKENEIRFHPDRNMLMRVMGIPWDAPMYATMKPVPLNKCDAFLLCSDGFWELIEERDMIAALKSSKTAQDWLDRMVSVVKRAGQGKETDNNSAIAIVCHR